MNRSLLIIPTLLVLGAIFSSALQAQAHYSGRGQRRQARLRDGSCLTPGKGTRQGLRKQDGTGPRSGTAGCPLTPAAPTK